MTFESKWKYRDRVIIDGDTSIIGVVTGFQFRIGYLIVEVSWVHDGAAQTAWLEEWRLQEAPPR